MPQQLLIAYLIPMLITRLDEHAENIVGWPLTPFLNFGQQEGTHFTLKWF